MNVSHLLALIGLAGSTVCILSYVYGYVWKPVGFRPLHALSLFATTVSMAQLSLAMESEGGQLFNAEYALAFLIVAGLAQALNAVKSRPADRVRRDRA